jgi:hypothetical protein
MKRRNKYRNRDRGASGNLHATRREAAIDVAGRAVVALGFGGTVTELAISRRSERWAGVCVETKPASGFPYERLADSVECIPKLFSGAVAITECLKKPLDDTLRAEDVETALNMIECVARALKIDEMILMPAAMAYTVKIIRENKAAILEIIERLEQKLSFDSDDITWMSEKITPDWGYDLTQLIAEIIETKPKAHIRVVECPGGAVH